MTAVTEAEMRLGVRLLPVGKRRQSLKTALVAMFTEDFAGRIRPFDTAAVPGYVEVVSTRRAGGRPISQFDAQIAAIALCHGDHLATRNVSDFEGCGLSLVDPWEFAVWAPRRCRDFRSRETVASSTTGFLRGKRYLILDGNTKCLDAFCSFFVRDGIDIIRLPRSPNLNAFAERFVRSI